MTSEQRPLVNNSHYFWVPRVIVVDRFDCNIICMKCKIVENHLCQPNRRSFAPFSVSPAIEFDPLIPDEGGL